MNNNTTPLFNLDEMIYIDSLWFEDKLKDFDNRLYKSCFLKSSLILEKLLKWFEYNTKEKLLTYDHNLILHRFEEGCYFGKHVDNGIDYNKNRVYTVGFHLISDYEGGEYVLYNPHQIIDKTPGVPYVSMASREHEILPITKGVRKSALIFIEEQYLVKTKMI